LVHLTDGDVLPASVVAGVSVAAPDGSMVKVIEPFVAEVHVSVTVPVAVTVGVKVKASAPLAAARTIVIAANTIMYLFMIHPSISNFFMCLSQGGSPPLLRTMFCIGLISNRYCHEIRIDPRNSVLKLGRRDLSVKIDTYS